MKSLLFIVGGLVLVIGATYITRSLSDYFVPTIWNYRIIVNINTPDGLVSGSAVRQLKVRKKFAAFLNPDTQKINYKLAGEAVIINLDKYGVLFALIDDYSHERAYKVFLDNRSSRPESPEFFRDLKIGKKVELTHDFPKFVVFETPLDPKSIKGLGRTAIPNVLGKGVTFNSIWIEVTTDPVTWGIEREIPWLPELKNTPGYIGGSSKYPYEDPTNTRATGADFSRGMFW